MCKPDDFDSWTCSFSLYDLFQHVGSFPIDLIYVMYIVLPASNISLNFFQCQQFSVQNVGIIPGISGICVLQLEW